MESSKDPFDDYNEIPAEDPTEEDASAEELMEQAYYLDDDRPEIKELEVMGGEMAEEAVSEGDIRQDMGLSEEAEEGGNMMQQQQMVEGVMGPPIAPVPKGGADKSRGDASLEGKGDDQVRRDAGKESEGMGGYIPEPGRQQIFLEEIRPEHQQGVARGLPLAVQSQAVSEVLASKPFFFQEAQSALVEFLKYKIPHYTYENGKRDSRPMTGVERRDFLTAFLVDLARTKESYGFFKRANSDEARDRVFLVLDSVGIHLTPSIDWDSNNLYDPNRYVFSYAIPSREVVLELLKYQLERIGEEVPAIEAGSHSPAIRNALNYLSDPDHLVPIFDPNDQKGILEGLFNWTLSPWEDFSDELGTRFNLLGLEAKNPRNVRIAWARILNHELIKPFWEEYALAKLKDSGDEASHGAEEERASSGASPPAPGFRVPASTTDQDDTPGLTQSGAVPESLLHESDNLPTYHDQPVATDHLGRKPFALAIVTRMNKMWENWLQERKHKQKKGQKDKAKEYSYMLHLHGPWGSGKSSLMNLMRDAMQFPDPALEAIPGSSDHEGAEARAGKVGKAVDDKPESTGSAGTGGLAAAEIGKGAKHKKKDSKSAVRTNQHRWVVVEFNAWQHQNMSEPWWVLMDSVFKQTRSQLKERSIFGRWSWLTGLLFSVKEWSRRHLAGVPVRFVLIGIAIILIGWFIVVPLFGLSNQEQIIIQDLEKAGLDLIGKNQVLAGVVSSLLGLLPVIGGLSRRIVLNSTTSARVFIKKASNPMDKISRHFRQMIQSVRPAWQPRKRIPVAIFIDDLDRCHPAYVVKLLEGIQTLFRENQVFYVVAADRQWIRTCFEDVYRKFGDTIERPGHRLGYLFIQKAFQISVRVPRMSMATQESFWRRLINLKEADAIAASGVEPRSEEMEKQAGESLERGNADVSGSGTADAGLTGGAESRLEAAAAEPSEHAKSRMDAAAGATPRKAADIPSQAAAEQSRAMVEQRQRAKLRQVFQEQKSEAEVRQVLQQVIQPAMPTPGAPMEAQHEILKDEDFDEGIAMEEALTRLASREIEERTESELQPYGRLLEPNPRSIKRLVNFYSFYRDASLIEGRNIEPGILARWLILVMRWPILAEFLEKHPEVVDQALPTPDGVPNLDAFSLFDSLKKEYLSLFRHSVVRETIFAEHHADWRALSSQDIRESTGQFMG